MKMNKEIFLAVLFGSLVGIVVNIIMDETGAKNGIRKVVRNEL